MWIQFSRCPASKRSHMLSMYNTWFDSHNQQKGNVVWIGLEGSVRSFLFIANWTCQFLRLGLLTSDFIMSYWYYTKVHCCMVHIKNSINLRSSSAIVIHTQRFVYELFEAFCSFVPYIESVNIWRDEMNSKSIYQQRNHLLLSI